jgi:hypothetical protein
MSNRPLNGSPRLKPGGFQTQTAPVRHPPTSIRLNPATRDAVKAFAASMGISFNAALSVLVSEALHARGLHPDQRNA